MASSNVVVQRHSNSAPTIFSSSGDGGGWDNYSEAAKVIALETFNKLIKEHRGLFPEKNEKNIYQK